MIEIIMKKWLKIIAWILIQIFLTINITFCLPGNSIKNIRSSTLSPELSINIVQFQQSFQSFIISKQDLEPEEEMLIAQSFEKQNFISAIKQKGLQFKIFFRKKQVDLSVFILLHTDNHTLRRKICQDLIQLKDERAFRVLRLHALTAKGLKRGSKRSWRAQEALIEMHYLNEEFSESLGVKHSLFEQILSGSSEVRNRALEILDRFDIRSEKELDNIIVWIESNDVVLLNNAAKRILKLGPRRLEKLREKGAINSIIQASGKNRITEPVFLNIVNALKSLEAEEEDLFKLYSNCFKNIGNGPYARKQAAFLLGTVEYNKHNAFHLLVKSGLFDQISIVRQAVILALGNLGDTRAIAHLEKLLVQISRTSEYDRDEWSKDFYNIEEECELIIETIIKLEKAAILSKYDPITRKHVENVFSLIRLLKNKFDLSREELKLLLEAALKHDLGKSRPEYYGIVVIPTKLAPDDEILKKFITEHAFISDHIVEELEQAYGIRTPLEEHIIIRNHHSREILFADPDFIDLPIEKKKRVRKLQEILMIIDWLCGFTERFRPPNWFDRVTIDAEDIIEKFKKRYGGIKYEFLLNFEEIVPQILQNQRAYELLKVNSRRDPFLIAQAMKSWVGEFEHYLIILRCRIRTLTKDDLPVCDRFFNALADPATEEVFGEEGADRLKETFFEIIDAALKNDHISTETEKLLHKISRQHPDSVFAQVLREYPVRSFIKDSELVQVDLEQTHDLKTIFAFFERAI